VELVRQARGAQMPQSFWTDPLLYQGGSDNFLGPTDPIVAADEAWGIDMEGEVAVITDDVPYGCGVEDAARHIKLVMLVNDVSLRNLIPAEMAKGFGFFQSKPASAFSPVAVTPDGLGLAWREGRLHRPLDVACNGEAFGAPDAGTDMVFNFPQLIAHAAKTRALSAGTIIGSGTVSNRDRSVGSACIAERRMLEQIETGAPITPFLKFGDRVRIEMRDDSGQSIFGAIDQHVRRI
jgi:fumarylacetoacetate (FAA) hydrolase